ncbi:GNAT family N-acetyltransferase [Bradyrhizobium sp. Pear76]|uniref:GNAT family N-acetyltransferase n=1 Tax=Bradyrhizobium oropedii TaxID=1571201 RepID=UPI001E54C894|nr:GNAT family N-acetyltransferase [Bradyrhizobium oropedii]MCC8961389.1 GNAT family N-acetyltransferase [Bradyrhizobium oropedii]
MKNVRRDYPRTVACNGTTVELSLLSSRDAADLKAFVATLPEHDLLFLSRDITHPKVIEAWIAAIPEGRIKSIVARESGRIVGCTAIALHELSWSRHVGELRVLVSPAMRGKGLGRLLIQECFVQALELGLTKLCVQMTVDQRAAISGFESIGFRAEALFRNHVKDREGKLHDLAVLSHDVVEVQSRMHAFGVSDILSS